MTSYPVAFGLIALFTAFTVAAQLLIRKTVSDEVLTENANIVDPLLGVVGTLFSVLLGFLVAGSMNRYHDISTTVDQEANGMANVYRFSRGLQSDDRKRIGIYCLHYCNAVIDQEWNMMQKGESSPQAWDAYQNLWESILSIDPGSSSKLSNLQSALLESIQQVGEARRLRLVSSQHGLTDIQWMVIFVGASITVLFTLFFPMKKLSFHLFLTILVTVSLGLNIWLLAAYSHPFAGQLRIQPYLFTLLRARTMEKLKALNEAAEEREYLNQYFNEQKSGKAGTLLDGGAR